MKRVAVCMLLFALVFTVSGCSRSKKTVLVPGGTATVTTEKGIGGEKNTVEVKTKEGKATFTAEKGAEITEAELGVPVYPGAESVSSGKFEGQGGQAQNVEHHSLSTKDDFTKVVAFYKSKLKNPQNSYVQEAGKDKMAMFNIEQGKTSIVVHVVYTEKEGKTIINVTKSNKP